MAISAELRASDGSIVIDLLTAPAELLRHEWQTMTADISADYVKTIYGARGTIKFADPIVEVLPIYLNGSAATIIAAIADIETLLRYAHEYTDPERKQYKHTLFRWQTEGEGGIKSQFVYTGSIQYPADGWQSVLMDETQPNAEFGVTITLTLVCAPFREGATQGVNGALVEHGLYVDDFAAGGTAYGRILSVNIGSLSPPGTGFDRLLIGLRPLYYGVADYRPKWKLTDGTPGTNTTATTDANALDTNVLETTYSATPIEAFRITVGDLGLTNPTHMHGNYNLFVLVANNGGKYKLRMAQISGNRKDYTYPRYTGAGDGFYSGYSLINMGSLSFPPAQISADNDKYNSLGFAIDVEWTDRNDSILFDHAFLIPNRHMLDLNMLFRTSLVIESFPDETQIATSYFSTTFEGIETPATNAFYAHPEGGKLVALVLEGDGSPKDFDYSFSAVIIDRYSSVRP